MANGKAGEFEIIIGDETLVMKFSFRAIAEIEEAFGEAIVKRFTNIDEEDTMKTLKDLVVLFEHTLEAGGNKKETDWLLDNMVLPQLGDYMVAVQAAMGRAIPADKPVGGQGNVGGGMTPPTGTPSSQQASG